MSMSPYAVILIVLIISLSFFLNTLVIIVMLKKATPTSIRDIIIISLACGDIFESLVGYSTHLFKIANNGEGGMIACKLVDFAITFSSTSSIYHLVALTVERYCSILYTLSAHQFLNKSTHAMYFLVPAWLQGLFWASSPLFGWGGHEREYREPYSCSVVSVNKSEFSMGYAYGRIVSNYFIPIAIISFFCITVQRQIKRMSCTSLKVAGKDSNVTHCAQKAEKQHFIMVVVIVAAFFIAWSPYTMCMIWLAVYQNIPVQLIASAAFFAKLSVLTNPIIYSIFYKEFRTTVKGLICRPITVAPTPDA